MVAIGLIVRPALGLAHVDQEDGQAVALTSHLVLGCGAGQQDHQVGVLGPAGPDLLAVDDIGVALAPGEGRDRRGVRAGGGLGDPEGLQADRAVGDARQPGFFLRRRPVPQ
jgi:hypothetical protein